MWGALILLYLGSSLVFVSVPLCTCSSKRVTTVLIAWSVCFASWFLYSPIYSGPPSVLKSTDRSLELHGRVRNWGDTVVCDPKNVLAQSKADVVKTVLASKKVRVAGSSHSWSGLICTDDTLLTMQWCDMALDGTLLTASSGCKVSQVQEFLGERGRVLHGFGSIMDQTMGGAVMTSLHGAQFHMFTDHVHAMSAVLANGTLIRVEGDDVLWWTSSMGLLGVVVDVEMRTHNYTSVRRATTFETFEKALTYLNDTSLHGLAITGVLEKDTFYVERFLDPLPATFEGLYEHSKWTVFGYDNIVQPLFVLFGWALHAVDLTRLQFFEHDERLGITHAWSHIVGYSSGSGSEYTVPLSQCSAALREMRDLNALSHLYLRKVLASAGKLVFAPVDSCAIEPYLFYTYNYGSDYHAYMERVEHIVNKHGGKTHWGKKWHLPYDHMIPSDFKAYRQTLDPSGKFLNGFARVLLDGGKYNYKPVVLARRGALWLTTAWFAIVAVPLALVLPEPDWNRLFQFVFGTLAVFFAWIALNVHDNVWEVDTEHGEDHNGAPLSVVWLLVVALLLIDTMFAYKRPIWVLLLRSGVTAGVIVDAGIRLWGCEACEHGMPTLLLGGALALQVVLMAVHKPKSAKYKRLQ